MNSTIRTGRDDHHEADSDAQAQFDAEIRDLIAALEEQLGEGASRWYHDESTETLYIELQALGGLTEEQIEQKAGPILDQCGLDFEEILLLPYSS